MNPGSQPSTPSRPPVRTADLLRVFGGLLILLGLAAGLAALSPAPWKSVASLALAGAKIGLIAWYFMRLNRQPALVRIFAVAGLFWLALLATLLASDYLMR